MTSNSLIRQPADSLGRPRTADIWDAALAGVIGETSRRSYKAAMVDFARFLLEARGRNLPSEPKAIFMAAAPLLASVSFHEVTAYREHLREHGYEPATVNARLAALNNMFIRMMRMDHIDQNPASSELVARMKVPNISTTEGLSASEAERVLRLCAADDSTAGKRDLALFLVSIYNGLRRAELVSLDVDGFRVIDETPVYIVTGKGNKKRTVEFIPEVWKAIVDWVELLEDDAGPLFRRVGRAGKKGQKITRSRLTTSGVYHIIKRRVIEAGIDKNISPHSLRHTYATLALLGNAPIQEVQISMGHVSPDTTFRYFRALEQVGRSPSRAIKLSWEQDETKEEP